MLTYTFNMNKTNTIEGVYSLGKNGIGYVKNREHNLVIEIPSHLSDTALHRDIVEVIVTDKEKNETVRMYVTEVKKESRTIDTSKYQVMNMGSFGN